VIISSQWTHRKRGMFLHSSEVPEGFLGGETESSRRVTTIMKAPMSSEKVPLRTNVYVLLLRELYLLNGENSNTLSQFCYVRLMNNVILLTKT